MAELPSATVTIEDTSVAGAPGVNLIAIIAPAAQSADSTPRVFGSSKALLDLHGYSPGADYAAMHMEETRKPVLFVAVPIATQGTVGRTDTSGNTGTSVPSVAAGASGALEETDGVVKVVLGGTIGTSQIQIDLSLDGGRTFKRVRLGTANSYVIPHVDLTLSFAAGTLVAGDTILTWHSTAPLYNQAGLNAARLALAAQLKQTRTWLIVGDVSAASGATDILTEANAYETVSDRFVLARAQVRDRLPYAKMSQVQVRMTGSPSLTFDTTLDTITRSSGSWVSDGFVIGDTVTIAGSASNNITTTITALTATVMTVAANLVNEGPTTAPTVVGTPTLTFAEVGATGDTLTRSRGSWLADGFRVGDKIAITGTASNNIVGAAGITAVTATVITFGTDDLNPESIGSYGVSVTAGELKAAWMATMDAAFASIDAQRRVDLGAGRGRKLSPVTGYKFRRPVQWAASLREYQHDVQVATWRKSDGPLFGWDLNDEEGNLVEFDERVDSGGLAARFTCFRTYSNGPAGAFIALSLTRDVEGSVLSRTHNMHVANVACGTVQTETENAIGQNLELDQSTGKATTDSLGKIRERVNTALSINLLQDKGEGKRASSAKWTPNPDAVLNVPGAELDGVLDLLLDGTLEKIRTRTRVQTAG